MVTVLFAKIFVRICQKYVDFKYIDTHNCIKHRKSLCRNPQNDKNP